MKEVKHTQNHHADDIFNAIIRDDGVEMDLILRTKDVDINFQHHDETPLQYCCRINSVRCAEQLLINGADTTIKSYYEGNTALHIACINQAINCILLLIRYGVEINEENRYKKTSLEQAFMYKRKRVIKNLLIHSDAIIPFEKCCVFEYFKYYSYKKKERHLLRFIGKTILNQNLKNMEIVKESKVYQRYRLYFKI